ncbi:uncharacterized protein LOC111700932 [Eurytemora carolleeae]|uniref:uncharacterized protein LOC111700932 n=1 Tax=Eurytemora carolleeae TaxID=1294199 RepID=UPI000C791AA2|nr:uncharacterized protein LOC111700932 [Eurytemora carolleeae]|eukprot:XP_023327783.1 uncharacterized protein LOC111700932 [Eurytemora affinis]
MALTIEDHKLWRKALKMTFPSAVVGNQRRNSITALKNQFSKGGSGIRFIIRFKIKGNDEFLLKTTVSVYDTDILVVSGASYYIWILEHFKELKKLVETKLLLWGRKLLSNVI